MDKRKLSAVLILALLIIGLVQAQQGGVIEDEVGSAIFTLDIINSLDQVILMDIESAADLAIFLTITVAFYAPLKFMSQNAFELISENFPTTGYGREGNVHLGVKLFSFAVALLAAQFLGVLLPASILSIVALVSIVLVAYLFISGGMATIRAAPNLRRADDELDQAEEELAEASDQADTASEEIRDVESTGSDSEARDAAQRVEKSIMELEDVEQKVNHALGLEEDQLEETIREAKGVLEDEEKEIRALNSIQGRYERAADLLQKLQVGMSEALQNNRKLTDGHLRSTGFNGGGWSYASGSNHGYDVDGAGFRHVVEDIEEALEEIQGVSKLENDEEELLKQEINELELEVQNFIQAHQLIQKIKSLISELEKEDKELEKIAEELGDRELINLVEKEEKQEMKMEEELNQLLEREEEIRNALQNALQLLDEELELDKQEVQDLKQEITETEELEAELKKIQRNFIPELGRDARETANQKASRLISTLEEIEREMDEIVRRKKREAEIIEGAEQEVRQALNSI